MYWLREWSLCLYGTYMGVPSVLCVGEEGGSPYGMKVKEEEKGLPTGKLFFHAIVSHQNVITHIQCMGANIGLGCTASGYLMTSESSSDPQSTWWHQNHPATLRVLDDIRIIQRLSEYLMTSESSGDPQSTWSHQNHPATLRVLDDIRILSRPS